MVCTICTDLIRDDFCAAPCGHTFHFECLSQWLAHQKSCPQCRERCLPRNVIKLYVDSSDLSQVATESLDPNELQEKLSTQKTLLDHKDQALEEARSSLIRAEKENDAWQLQNRETHRKLLKEQSHISIMKREVSSMKEELAMAEERKEKFLKLKKRVSTLEGVERILKGATEETESLVTTHKSPSSLATFVVALKRDYEVVKEKKLALVKEVSLYKKQLQIKERELQSYQEQRTLLETDLHTMEGEKKTLRKKVEMLQAAIDSPGSRCALKRILESPMPDNSANKRDSLDLGTSPLLSHTKPQASNFPLRVSNTAIATGPTKTRDQKGAKRPHDDDSRPRENIIMPVSKVQKLGGAYVPKSLSTHVLKKGLKFAPKKSNPVRLNGSGFVFRKSSKLF